MTSHTTGQPQAGTPADQPHAGTPADQPRAGVAPAGRVPAARAALAKTPLGSVPLAKAQLAGVRSAGMRWAGTRSGAAIAMNPLPRPGEPPAPTMGRLAWMCAWSALLGFLGVAVGVRGAIAMLVTTVPDWYQPALVGLGLGGILLTVVAFLTVQYRIVPFVLLTMASGTLLAAIIATGQAT